MAKLEDANYDCLGCNPGNLYTFRDSMRKFYFVRLLLMALLIFSPNYTQHQTL
jgi:hypothetical protein